MAEQEGVLFKSLWLCFPPWASISKEAEKEESHNVSYPRHLHAAHAHTHAHTHTHTRAHTHTHTQQVWRLGTLHRSSADQTAKTYPFGGGGVNHQQFCSFIVAFQCHLSSSLSSWLFTNVFVHLPSFTECTRLF